MANITQQKKRIRRAAAERMENLRYRSTIKTQFRGLEAAASSGNGDETGQRARELTKLIDRAAARGALHRNNASHKKSRVSRIVASGGEDGSAA